MILSELHNTMPKQTDILIFKNSIYYIYQNLLLFRKPLLEDVIFDTQVYIIQTAFLFLENTQKVKKYLAKLKSISVSDWHSSFLKTSVAPLLLKL